MTNGQREDVDARYKSVGQWLELASENASAAVLLANAEGLDRQALYMTQQGMELAVKGLARWIGFSHEAVKVEGHNVLRLYAKINERIINATGTARYADQMLAGLSKPSESFDVVSKLDELLDLSARPQVADARARQFYRDIMTISPEVAYSLLLTLEKQYEIVDNGLSEPALENLFDRDFHLSIPPSGKYISSYVAQQMIGQLTKRQKLGQEQILILKELVPQIAAYTISIVGKEQFLAELKARRGKFKVTRDEVTRLFDIPKSSMGLPIVGSLVWPHESPSRYPAPPRFDDLTPAAAAQRGQFGAGDYSADLGVIRYIKEIAAHARKITDMLNSAYYQGVFFPDWDAHPPSEIVQSFERGL